MKIILTLGDCNGIGIETMIKGIIEFDKTCDNSSDTDISIAGNIQTLSEYINHFNFPTAVTKDSIIINDRICPVLNCAPYSPVEFGKETISAGRLAAKAIEEALDSTIQKKFDALVTMPVSKSSLYLAGWKYPGHTEMLADKCNVKNPLMILCSEPVRIGLATIHIPLKDVPKNLSKQSLTDISEKFNRSLSVDFGRANPKIAVLGLNPHAGENGNLGKEENETIIPAINDLKTHGMQISGPYPADGFFARDRYNEFDGILAMYHDQGLIPLKIIAKDDGVNVTAGLPIVRTSPDHGTAFDIAGKNKASGKSVCSAIKLAIEIVRNRDIRL